MRESKPRITQSAAYSHLYGNSLYKKLVRGLRKPQMNISCHLYEQFVAYISRGLCNPRLIFPRINRPNVCLHGEKLVQHPGLPYLVSQVTLPIGSPFSPRQVAICHANARFDL